MLYGISETTKTKLEALIDQGGGSPASDAGVPFRQSSWVKVSGSAASGWYPCVASTAVVPDQWIDHDGACEVAAPNTGETLETGKRYLAVRLGDVAGKPRYRAVRGGGGGANGSDPTQQGQPGGWRYQQVVTAINSVTIACDGNGQITAGIDFATASVKVLV